jgi:hypothetical protein
LKNEIPAIIPIKWNQKNKKDDEQIDSSERLSNNSQDNQKNLNSRFTQENFRPSPNSSNNFGIEESSRTCWPLTKK